MYCLVLYKELNYFCLAIQYFIFKNNNTDSKIVFRDVNILLSCACDLIFQLVDVFVGIDHVGNPSPQAVGTFCEYIEPAGQDAESFTSFDDYASTLTLDCPESRSSGKLSWTPDDTTPDVVYYQVREGM